MNPAECRRPAKWRYLAANPGECQCRPPLKMGNCLASLFGGWQVLRWPHYPVPVFLIALLLPKKLLFAHLLALSLPKDWFVPTPLCPWLFSIPPLLLSLIEMCYLWDHFDKTHVGTITWSFFISRKTLPYQSVIYWQLQNQLLGLCSMPFNVWSDHLLTLNCIWSCVKSIKPKDDVCHFFHLCSAQKGDTEHLWHTDIQLKVAIQSQTSIQIQSFLVSGSQIISAVLSW